MNECLVNSVGQLVMTSSILPNSLMQLLKSSDKFVGRIIYPFEKIPLEQETVTATLHSHSLKSERGDVCLQMRLVGNKVILCCVCAMCYVCAMCCVCAMCYVCAMCVLCVCAMCVCAMCVCAMCVCAMCGCVLCVCVLCVCAMCVYAMCVCISCGHKVAAIVC